MLRFSSLLCFYFLSVGVFAAVEPKIFSPQVTIIKKAPSDTIEIKVKQTDFLAVYSSSIGSFRPFNIPFIVRSVGGSPLNYRVKLNTSQHYCRDENGVDEALLNLVSTKLDGGAFPTSDSNLPGAEGLLVTGSDESKHNMSVTFSSLQQENVAKICYGTFILIAEITSL